MKIKIKKEYILLLICLGVWILANVLDSWVVQEVGNGLR